jgi:hypothetical protein
MTGTHARNTSAMLASRRCGARTRDDGACRAPAVHGKARCRMHGGARRSGAPKGNQNARKHGLFTCAARAEQDQLRQLLDESNELLHALKRPLAASGSRRDMAGDARERGSDSPLPDPHLRRRSPIDLGRDVGDDLAEPDQRGITAGN